MNVKKILIGTIIWSLGMLVTIIAVNTLRDRHMGAHLLRWIAWIYLGSMLVAGATVVIHAFKNKDTER